MRSLIANGALRAVHSVRKVYWFIVRPTTIGVRGIVVNEQREVLLVRHSYMRGSYLPGGRVERGETLLSALIRELQAEAGIIVESARVFGAFTNFSEHKSDHIVVFCVDRWRTRPASSIEISAVSWSPLNHLPEDTSPATRRRLSEFVADRPTAGNW